MIMCLAKATTLSTLNSPRTNNKIIIKEKIALLLLDCLLWCEATLLCGVTTATTDAAAKLQISFQSHRVA